MTWGTPKEIETRRRILLSIWAYAYEEMSHGIVSDAIYDVESYQVDLNIRTDRPDMDIWFVCNFQPWTGTWIHGHPELDKIVVLYLRHYGRNCPHFKAGSKLEKMVEMCENTITVKSVGDDVVLLGLEQ